MTRPILKGGRLNHLILLLCHSFTAGQMPEQLIQAGNWCASGHNVSDAPHQIRIEVEESASSLYMEGVSVACIAGTLHVPE